jgi:hypothetical protein
MGQFDTITGILLGVIVGIWILLALGLVMGLSEVALYQSLSGYRNIEPRDMLQKAWSQIGSWFAYISWSAVIFWGTILVWLVIWGGIFAHELGFLGSSLVGSSWADGTTISFWVFATLGLICGIIWFSISVTAGKPQYILSGQTGFWAYLELRYLSEGRWWRVYANIMLAGIITSMAVSIFDGVLSQSTGFWRIFELLAEGSGGLLERVNSAALLDPTVAQTKLSEFLNQLDTGVGFWSFLTTLVSLALSVIVTGFLQTFIYVVGQDIATPASTHERV